MEKFGEIKNSPSQFFWVFGYPGVPFYVLFFLTWSNLVEKLRNFFSTVKILVWIFWKILNWLSKIIFFNYRSSPRVHWVTTATFHFFLHIFYLRTPCNYSCKNQIFYINFDRVRGGQQVKKSMIWPLVGGCGDLRILCENLA